MTTKGWPYPEDDTIEAAPDRPSWFCEGGTCTCHPIKEGEVHEYAILLCDPDGHAMPDAKARVLQSGHVIKDEVLVADGEGWLHLSVERPLNLVTLEWVPGNMPRQAGLPYRQQHHLDMDSEEKLAARRRLHNLGFSQRGSLEEDVKDFQTSFSLEPVSGDMEDIKDTLIDYHDNGQMPPLRRGHQGDSDWRWADVKKGQAKEKKPENGGGAKKTQKKKSAARTPTPGQWLLTVHMLFARQLKSLASSRWPQGGPHPVVGATVSLFQAGKEVSSFITNNGGADPKPRTLDSAGTVILDMSNLPDETYVLRLNPDPRNALRPDTPAGPINDRATRELALTPAGAFDIFPDSSKDDMYHTRLRILELSVDIKGGQIDKVKLVPDMHDDDAAVAHGDVVKLKPNSLLVDWKPDWVKCYDTGRKDKMTDPNDSKKELSLAQLIVLHHTVNGTPGECFDRFKKGSDVGAHYVVDDDGHVIKVANENDRTQHAGHAYWRGLISSASPVKYNYHAVGFNDISVGIEQINIDEHKYTRAQVEGARRLVRRLIVGIPVAHNVPVTKLKNVVGHGDIALTDPSAKSPWKTTVLGKKDKCPGIGYDWVEFEKNGCALQPRALTDKELEVAHDSFHGYFKKNPQAVLSQSHAPADVVDTLRDKLQELGYFIDPTIKGFSNSLVLAVYMFHIRYFSGPGRKDDYARINHFEDEKKIQKEEFNIHSFIRMFEVFKAGGSGQP